MKFYLISLGCAKNLVDSEKLSNRLTAAGFSLTDDINESSLIIVNTCGFIKEAKQESIDTALNVLREKPQDAKVVVYGCLVQRYQEDLKRLIPEVDLFLPVMGCDELAKKIIAECGMQSAYLKPSAFASPRVVSRPSSPKVAFTPPSYKYVKISDGCKNLCSYCAIPLIRGPLKSTPAEQVIKEIKQAVKDGFFEINLIAQDITAYGADIYGKPSLEKLLGEILKIKGDFWLRLLYLYPTRITGELIRIINSDPRIVKYMDIPVQHVNTRILRLMNRRYTREKLIDTISILRENIKGIALRTSLIVGFPTESEEEFEELREFAGQMKFDHLGVFEYSPEEDTKAYSLKPEVPARVKRARKKMIMSEQIAVVKEKNRSLKGRVLPCLIEQPVDDFKSVWSGRIYSQAPEVDGLTYITGYSPGASKTAMAKITDYKDYDLIGKCEVSK